MNHKKYRLRFKFFLQHFPPIPRHGDSLKISEDSRKTSSVVIWFAFVYPCVSTEDPEEQKCYFLYYYIKEMYNIKKSSGSSGTSRTYTQLNQNTGEDFREKRSSNFTIQSSGSSGSWAANRVHLDSTKFLFSSKYFSQAKVPEKYGSQEIQS